MATIVQLTPDPFTTSFKSNNDTERGGTGSNRTNQSRQERGLFSHVRRPVRGLQIKDDTYATIQVVSSDGIPHLLIDSGDGGATEGGDIGTATKYSNFLLQRVAETRQEKMQVVETFGEPYVFFFGERPRVVQFSGVLINSEDFNWRAEWWENYDKFLRGTKCVQTQTRVVLSWDDIVVMGYMTDCSAQEQSTDPLQVPFSFNIFLTHYENISRIGSTEFPRSAEEFNLDPNTLDVEGLSDGFQSSTFQVRDLNNQNQNSSSLLAGLRSGIQDFLSNTSSILSSGIIDQGAAFLTGRLVRVPIGAAGGAIFDDVQIALGSVNPQRVLNGGLQGQIGGQTFTIKAPASNKTFQGAIYGRIAENIDEFIARIVQTSSQSTDPVDLFSNQISDDANIGDRVREIFQQFGINTDPPNDLLVGAMKKSFDMTTIAASAAVLSARNSNNGTPQGDGTVNVQILGEP